MFPLFFFLSLSLSLSIVFFPLTSVVGSSWDLGFQMWPGWVKPCGDGFDSAAIDTQRWEMQTSLSIVAKRTGSA